MPSRKLLVVAAVAALGLCFAQGASALHGGVSGGIKFKLSGTFECTVDPGEMTSLFHNEVSPPFVEFKTSTDKTITCTKNDGVNPPNTGEFTGSFRTTGPLQVTCEMPPATPVNTSKQTISSSCPSGDVEGTLTAVGSPPPPGGFTAGSVYNIGGADEPGFACAAVFPAGGLPEGVILQTEQIYSSSESCGVTGFSSGDVFAATGLGDVKRHGGSGAFRQTLADYGICGSGSTRGMAFDSANNLYVTMSDTGQVCRFDKDGNPLGTVAGPYEFKPESIAFNNSGHAYVGKALGDKAIHEIDVTSVIPTEVHKFLVPFGPQGSDWIDLACDQTTMFYTSEGRSIRRFDVSSFPGAAVLPDITVPGELGAERAFALRIIPSGLFKDQILLADWKNVKRIDTSGNVLATYDVFPIGGADQWFSLDLDANGIHFWAVNFNGNFVHRFEIAGAGAHLPIQSFQVKTPGIGLLAGVRVKHGLNCGTQPLPDQTVLDGTMKMRPCGANDVDSPASCVHEGVPVQNDANALTQANGIPAVSSPDDINVKDNKKNEGIWVAILENDFVPVGTIDPGMLLVENVPPNTKKLVPQCVLDPGVSLRCRYSKKDVAEALASKYSGVGGGTAVFMKVTSGDPVFETNAIVNLVP